MKDQSESLSLIVLHIVLRARPEMGDIVPDACLDHFTRYGA